ncbi:MAG: FtsX-like permease family protein, partial [Candidatus Bipolaricaulota bacterium]
LMWGITAGMFDSMTATHIELDYGSLKVHRMGYRDDHVPASGFTPDETAQALDAIHALPGAHGAPRLLVQGLLRSSYGATGVEVRGVDPTLEPTVTRLGTVLIEGRYVNATGEALLGGKAARRLDVRVGERVVVLAQGMAGTKSLAFTVVGIYATGLASLDERTIVVPITDAQALAGVNGATEVAVGLPRGRSPDAAAVALRERLGEPYEVLTFDQGNPLISGIIRGNTGEMMVTMVLLAILAGFGVANTVLFSVLERTREFGVMLSLGLNPRRLAALVVAESVLASALGFALGSVGGYVLVRYLAHTGIPLGAMAEAGAEFGIPPRIYAAVHGWYWAASFVVVVATGAVAAWYPARRAAKLEPVEAIRQL